MFDLAHFLRAYILPILIICGFFLNMLSFFVMRRIKNSTTSYYMACLGLIDSGVLLVGGLSLWLFAINQEASIPMTSKISCKLIPFLMYTLADMSVLIIVTMTAERFYAVWRPLQANKIGKKRKFRLNFLISILICSSINSHFMWTHSLREAPVEINEKNYPKLSTTESAQSSSEKTGDSFYLTENNYYNRSQMQLEMEYLCVNVLWDNFYEKYWVYIDATIYSFLPSILLTIFNISIIRYLFKAADESIKLKRHSFSYHTMSPNNNNNNTTTHQSNQNLSNLPYQLHHHHHRHQHNQGYGSLRGSYIRSSSNYFKYGNYLNEQSCLNDFKRSSMVTTLSRMGSLKSSTDTHRIYFNNHSSVSNANVKNGVKNVNSEIESRVEPSSYASIISRPNPKMHTIRRFNTRLTVMLIALNITFCIFSMPMVILQIVYYSLLPVFGNTPEGNAFSSTTPISISASSTKIGTTRTIIKEIDVDYEIVQKMDLLKAVAELLQYLNHSTNFFLYSFSGKTFRNETKLFIRYHLKRLSSLMDWKRYKAVSLCCNKKKKSASRYSFKMSI